MAALSKQNRWTIRLLLLSNIFFLGLLFYESMIKFDAINYGDDNIEHIQVKNESQNILDDMISWAINPYSICYIFNQDKNISNENRIAFVTVSDLTVYPHPKSWLPLARMNRLQYARSFGYDYCDFPRDWDFTTFRESEWVKFGALYTVLSYYQYVVWYLHFMS